MRFSTWMQPHAPGRKSPAPMLPHHTRAPAAGVYVGGPAGRSVRASAAVSAAAKKMRNARPHAAKVRGARCGGCCGPIRAGRRAYQAKAQVFSSLWQSGKVAKAITSIIALLLFLVTKSFATLPLCQLHFFTNAILHFSSTPFETVHKVPSSAASGGRFGGGAGSSSPSSEGSSRGAPSSVFALIYLRSYPRGRGYTARA